MFCSALSIAKQAIVDTCFDPRLVMTMRLESTSYSRPGIVAGRKIRQPRCPCTMMLVLDNADCKSYGRTRSVAGPGCHADVGEGLPGCMYHMLRQLRHL